MTEERENLLTKRDSIDEELAEIGAELEDVQAELETIDDDIAAAIEARDTATETFLTAERLPQSIGDDTRDAVASYLDTLAEKRDVRSEEMVRKTAERDVELTNAQNARDDIDETQGAIERLVERTAESQSRVADARDELDETQSQFTDELVALAAQFEAFGIDLTEETLDAVIDERIPARNTALLTSIENASGRVAELSTEKSALEDDRDRLQSIDGGGTCPTCHQNVGSERTDSEVESIEADLHEVEQRLGAAKRDRDELIDRRDELSRLRDEATALRSFRSESVAEAAGRLEDREADHADLEADLEEERAGLAELETELDDAEAAITSLETEIVGIEGEIDRLQTSTENGERCLETFEVVDELRVKLDRCTEKLSELQATYEEKEVERAALDAEIEALSE